MMYHDLAHKGLQHPDHGSQQLPRSAHFNGVGSSTISCIDGPQLPRCAHFNGVGSAQPSTKAPRQAIDINVVRCPRAHVMEVRVVREMLRGFEALRSSVLCARCKVAITMEDARYSCDACSISYCTACSTNFLSKPLGLESVARPLCAQVVPVRSSPLNVKVGDILCCGPDAWGIHHLMLVISAMEPDPEAFEFLHLENSLEAWSCETIECTRNRVGPNGAAWFSTRTFFSRDRATSAAALVGCLETGTLNIELFETPVPVKLLMHPLRKGHGGPTFDVEAFQEAVKLSTDVSQRWGLATAIKGLFTRALGQDCLDPDDYSTAEEREELLEKLSTSWSSSPICSSVVIVVWQYYFKLACSSPDAAAQQILRWIPLLSDKTMPSVLLKVLTKLGWVLRGNLDA